jgi:hypothetical protein
VANAQAIEAALFLAVERPIRNGITSYATMSREWLSLDNMLAFSRNEFALKTFERVEKRRQ